MADESAGWLRPRIATLPGIEVRSIDQIPSAERHGRVRDQFTFWFGINANLFQVVLGGVAVLMGLNVFWASLAIVIGTVIGLILMGFHAIQGPVLGVPQMIQSRGQFGFYGAVLVFAASVILDFGFLAAQLVIQAEAMNLLVSSISLPAWIAILTIPVIALTIYGYDLIHRWQRLMTVVLGVTFAIVLIQAIARGGPVGETAGTHAPPFALFVGAAGLFVIDMVSYAPYVSDYSRYLPEAVDKNRTFWAVIVGAGLPTIFCGILGAYLTGLLPHETSTVAAIADVSGKWVLVIMAVSLIGSDAINAYTGMLALVSIVSCFKGIKHSVSIRVVGSLVLIAAGAVSALLGYKHFIENLSNFLNVLLYVFIPWSAINLTDYYLVKRGKYDVASFFTPKGRYGGFLWPGLVAYVLAVAAQIPFIDQAFYKGPLVSPLGGVDVSWIVGGVAGVVFYLIAMKLSTLTSNPQPPTTAAAKTRGTESELEESGAA